MKHINITKQQLHTFIDKEIDKQLEIIGCASDKLKVIEKYFDEEIPF